MNREQLSAPSVSEQTPTTITRRRALGLLGVAGLGTLVYYKTGLLEPTMGGTGTKIIPAGSTELTTETPFVSPSKTTTKKVSPTTTPTRIATATPTVEPTQTVKPVTKSPTATQTPTPTETATVKPTNTAKPTKTATPEPTATPKPVLKESKIKPGGHKTVKGPAIVSGDVKINDEAQYDSDGETGYDAVIASGKVTVDAEWGASIFTVKGKVSNKDAENFLLDQIKNGCDQTDGDGCDSLTVDIFVAGKEVNSIVLDATSAKTVKASDFLPK